MPESSDFIDGDKRRVVHKGVHEVDARTGPSTGGVKVGKTDETPDEISKQAREAGVEDP